MAYYFFFSALFMEDKLCFPALKLYAFAWEVKQYTKQGLLEMPLT